MPRMEEDVSTNVGLLGHLHGLVREHPEFEVLSEPTLVYCFRYLPNGLAERREEPEVQELLDRLNEEIVEAVQREAIALLTTMRVTGRVAIRISIASQRTLKEDIDATFEAIARWGRACFKKLFVSYESKVDMEAQSCLSESHSSSMEVSAT
jgi:glutamate/tyrosine decarboxylase-like PLP-dependent enzyme